MESYERIIGLDLENLVIDGCLVKAPCGGKAAGKSPVDRGKQGTKRPLMNDGKASRSTESPRARTGMTPRCCVLPSNDLQVSAISCRSRSGAIWMMERTNSWHNREFKKLAICTERKIRVIDALISLTNSIILVRRLIG